MKNETNKQMRIGITLGLLLGVSVYGTAWAAPATNALPVVADAKVIGTNTVSSSGSTMTVAQDVTKTTAQINWTSFNIGSAATVNFKQPSTGATMINNVIGNNMSEIAGQMNANGNIVLINPSGITFYNGATVNVGGLAVYAANSTDISAAADKNNQGNIIIENGVTINAGIGTALAQAAAMGMDTADFAVGIGSNTNKIRLVANGNISIGDGAKLTAIDQTTVSGTNTVGEEEFSVGGNANIAYGQVIIRSDANADDYGSVTINGTPVITTTESHIFYNAPQVGVATTSDGVKYNKKDYSSAKDFSTYMNSTIANTRTLVTGYSGKTAADAEVKTDNTYKGTSSANAKMLINNIAQLQDIDTNVNDTNNAYGNLAGIYALGRNIDATADKASYVENGVLYKSDASGNKIAISTTDNGIFDSATQKTTSAGTVITYGSSQVTATISSNAYAYKADGTFSEVSGSNTYTTNTGNTTTTLNNSTNIFTRSGGATAYTVTAGTYSKTDSATYAILTNGSSVYTTTDGTTVLLNGSAYSGTDVTADMLKTATDNIKGANTSIATFLSGSTETRTMLSTAVTEFTNNAAELAGLGTATGTINSANWYDGKGFDPIGNTTDKPFTGYFDGFGGDATHTLSNLTINRPTQDNVGLFGVVGKAGKAGGIISALIANPKIVGQNNVGSIAGQLLNGSTISWSHTYGSGIKGTNTSTTDYVKVAKQTDPDTGVRTNIGGLAGYVNASTISNASNSVTVIGQTEDITDGNVTNVGGIAGALVNGSKLVTVANDGNVFGEKETGGLAGYANDSDIGAVIGVTDTTASSHNNGQVTGTTDTGGIVGHAVGIKLRGVYNSNEDTALSANSQYYVDASGNIVKQGGSKGTALAGKSITSADALSTYGQITGTTNTGGLVGLMENGTVITTSSIDIAYNAGNIKGTTNTGGLVGQLTGGTITNAYNGDNNTVIREAATIPDAVKALDAYNPTGVTDDPTYTYSAADAAYYSFYTTNGTTKTYYYYVPVNGTVTKGAGGIFVNADGQYVDVSGISTANRFYLNRVGYKDANISGTTGTGGIVGAMSAGSLDITYDTGTVTGTDTATTGALVGTLTGGTATNSFYANDTDISTGKKFSNQSTGIGSTADSGTVKGNTLAYYRQRDNLKKDFGNTFVGEMIKVDDTTGYEIYTSGGATYYYDPNGNIFKGSTTTVAYTYVAAVGATPAHYVDGDGVSYTLTKTDKSTSSTITLTPSGAGTTVTLVGTMVPSNQSDTWLAYEDQTTPLLKYFMNDIDISRKFVYDGTTHNLKTDDVDNVYGRADFSDGKAGKNVKVDGYANSATNPGSSVYYYDTSSIWSPQHGFKLNALASVTITPVDLTIYVSGKRTYGDVNTTTGYYVSVPYTTTTIVDGQTVKTTVLTLYEVDSEGNYTKVTDTNAFFGTYEHTPEGLASKAEQDGKYVVTLDGIIKDEVSNIKTAVDGVLTSINGTSGTGVTNIFSSGKAASDQLLNAGNYGLVAGNATGITADYNDYKISYSGNLTVDKASLYYTYDGSRSYGSENSTGSHTYTLVGKDADSSTTSIEGYLKSFDTDKLSLTGNVINAGVNATSYSMTGVVNANNYNITANGTQNITASTAGSYYQVMVDSSGTVIGYVLKSLDNGSSLKLTGTSDDNTTALNNNYNLKWTAGGTISNVRQTTSSGVATTTITANDSTQKITPVDLTVTIAGKRDYGTKMTTSEYRTSTGSPMGTAGYYYVDIVGKVGNDTTATILGSNSSNANLLSLISGIEGTYGDGTTKLNNHSKVGTYYISTGKTDAADSDITVTGQDTAGHYNILAANNYNYTVKNGDHREIVNKINTTITTTAHREYGNTPSIGTNTTVDSMIESGMTDWDRETFDASAATYKNSGLVDNSLVTTNAGTYTNQNYITGSSTTKNALTTAYGINYNITYADTYTVNKAPITITVTGRRDYGSNMTASGAYTTTDNSVPGIDTLAKGLYNVDVQGLKAAAGDTKDNVFNAANLKTKLGTVDNAAGGNTDADVVGSHTNIGSYTKDTAVDFTLDNTNAIDKTNNILNAQNYYVVANGANTIKIVPKALTLTTTGGKTYNENAIDPTDAAKYNISADTLASWDSTLLSGNKTGWIGLINHKNTAQNAGTYGTNGTNNTDGYLTYTTENQSTIKNVLANYDVTFKDLYTIDGQPVTIYIEDTRSYGDNVLTNVKFTQEGILTDQIANLWDANSATWLSKYYDYTTSTTALLQGTHAGSYGTNGYSGNTYAADHALRLSADDITSIKNTLNNYKVAFTDKLTVSPIALTATISGERTYGNSMTKNAYTNTDGSTLTNGTWNVALTGLKSWDSASTVLNDTATKTLLNGIETTYASDDTKLTNHTNVGTYALNGTGTLSGTNIALTGNGILNQYQNGVSDYTITNGAHQVKIDTKAVTLTTQGTKIYGNVNPSTYTISDGGAIATWDKESKFTNNLTTWNGLIVNPATNATNHGTYGTNGTTISTAYLRYGTDGASESTIKNDIGSNYNVTFKDLFTVERRPLTIITSGSKTYGEANPAASALTITAATATADTGLVAVNGNDVTFAAKSAGDWKNMVTDAATTTTHAGTHGTNGTMDTSGILTYSGDNQNTISGNLDNDYIITYQDLLTVNKAALTVNVAGKRYYGDNMNAAYVTDGSGAPTNKNYNVTGTGMKNGESLAGLLSTSGLDAKLGAVDTGTGNNTNEIGRLTNANTTAYNVDGSIGSYGTITLDDTILGADSNYTVTAGTRTIQIDKAPVTYTISGSQNYGVNASTTKTAGAFYSISDLIGLKNGESFNQNLLAVTNGVTNTTGVGTYTKTTTTKGISEVTNYIDAGSTGFNINNYDISFTSSYVVNKAPLTVIITGSRIYGDANSTTTNYSVTNTATQNNEKYSYTGIANTVGQYDDVGDYYKNWTGKTNTTNAITGLNGLADKEASGFNADNYNITYVTDYTVNQRPLHYSITGTQGYGQTPETTGASYTVTPKSGVTSEGLVGTQNIDKSKLGVTNIVTSTSDVGEYPNAAGITAVDFTGTGVGTNGFKASNYNIIMDSSAYTVTKRQLHYSITGTQSYGDTPGTTGASYTFNTVSGVTNEGLVGTQNIDKSKLSVTNVVISTTHVGDYVNDAGITGVTGFDTAALNGFKTSNYNIIKDSTDYKVTPVALTLYTSGSKVYGAAATTSNLNTITGTGWKNSDADILAAVANQTTLKGYVNNSKAAANGNHVGSYGTEGTDEKAIALSYSNTNKTDISTLFHNDYTITYTDKFDITPATLTATVTGERDYGANLPQNSYTTADTATKGTWNLKLAGLAGGDTATTVLNDANVKAVLNAIDSGDGTATTTMGSHTNAGTYALDGTALTGTKVALTTGILNTNANGKYDYTITNGEHQAKIDKIDVTITTTGERLFGAANPDTSTYTINQAGLTAWDETAYYGTNGTDGTAGHNWKSGITNTTTTTTAKGVYGTLSTEEGHKAQVLSYTDGSQLPTDLSTNYNIAYADRFSIGKTGLVITITGSKIYSDPTDLTLSKYNISSEGLKNKDTLNYTGLTNTVALYDNVGTYTKDTKLGTGTARGITELTGLSGFAADDYDITYKTTYTIDPKALLLTINGSRTYGNDNTTITYDNIADTKGAIVNPADQTLLANYQATLKGAVQVATGITATTDAGTYGTNGSTGKEATLTYSDAQKTATATQLNNNYTIKYADKLTINPRDLHYTITGTQTYGQTPDATGTSYSLNTVLLDGQGLIGSQGIDKSKLGVINNVNSTSNVGGYADATGIATVDFTGTNVGTNGFKASNYNLIKDSSNYTVTPADLVIHISGNKTYGDTTSTNGNAYTYSTTGATGGLQNGETINYSAATVNFTGLDDHANAGSYYKNYAGKTDTTGDTVDDMTGLTGTGNFKTGNYNISYVTDYTINPKALTITTTGTKVYGDADPDTSSYTMHVTTGGLTSWDSSKLTNNLKNNIVNSTNEQSDVGTYGTENAKTQVLSYGDAIDSKLNHNYSITYVDNFSITKRPISYTIEGTKDYGTGSEHTEYGLGSFTNVPDFAQTTVNGNTVKNLTNTSDRYTNAGDYNNSLLSVTHSGDWTKNYEITEHAILHVIPADFTYTADRTTYWQGTPIPSQTGRVTNRYGEDVNDLVGSRNWETPATGMTAGTFYIFGHGANDNSGNYRPIQSTAPDNLTALVVKPMAKDPVIEGGVTDMLAGAWGPVRVPLLDIRYLHVEGTEGIDRWTGHVAPAKNFGEVVVYHGDEVKYEF